MIEKLLWPLLYPALGILVSYVVAHHRRNWSFIDLFKVTKLDNKASRREDIRRLFEGLRSTLAATCFIYAMAWQKEIMSAWHKHPILVCILVGLLLLLWPESRCRAPLNSN